MKEPPTVLETLTSFGAGVAAFCALLLVRAALDWHRAVTREHHRGCVCPIHRRRDPKVPGSRRRSTGRRAS